MKPLAVLSNIVLVVATCIIVVTEGLPVGPFYLALTLLMLLVPGVTVVAIARRPSAARNAVRMAAAVLLGGLLALGAADARAQFQGPPREVRRIYWELQKTFEVLVQLIPENPVGKPPLVSLTFRAYFPGVAKRNPYTSLPEWPTGKPARMTLTADPQPMVMIRDLTLRLELDGSAVDLTGPGRRYRNIPCVFYTDACAPNGVEAEIDASFVRSLLEARVVTGQALGLPIRLTTDDQAAVAAFASRIGLLGP